MPLEDKRWFVVFCRQEEIFSNNPRLLRNTCKKVCSFANTHGMDLTSDLRVVTLLASEVENSSHDLVEVAPLVMGSS